MLKSNNNICCDRMEREVVNNPKGVYQNSDIIIVAGRDSYGDLNYLCYNKIIRKTTKLDKCLWCKTVLT